jgi:DNA-binding NtrC family response regulator
MMRLYPTFERLARSRLPLVLEGETGTGKELLAESLHLACAAGRFVVFDCSAIAPDLVERELFGGDEPGLFEEADGGTIFFDQVDDLAMSVQAKLVRALDRGEIRRVHGRRWIKVDVRVLAAARRDLDEAANDGRLREDLFERLTAARIALPPLRDREGDIPFLVRHFSEEMTGSPEAVPPEVLARFAEHLWPGNVRELRSAVARYIATGEFHPERPRSSAPPPCETTMPFAIARRLALSRFERSYVVDLLAAHGGNVTQAAHASGLALRYFRVLKARAAKVEPTI